MPDRVVVRVPATVANLGPGFDCLGLALDWHNEVRVERADALEITASGAGAEAIARDETNLVARGLAAVLGELPPVRIHQTLAIPFGRGFGSSASAIVAGLRAGAALAGTDGDLLEPAVDLEGHADNVAPALLGGVTLIGRTVVSLPVPEGLCVLVCVSPSTFPTDQARAGLPSEVSRSDAIANMASASMLVVALSTGRLDLLLEATEDRLHQAARFALMPETGGVVRALRAGGIAAFLSGAGPSVAALVDAASADASVAAARAAAPDGWEVRLEEIDPRGAQVVESS